MAAPRTRTRRLVALSALALSCATGAPRAPETAAPAAAPPAPLGARFSKRVEFTPLPDLEVAHGVNPHDHQGQPLCQRCHLQGEEQLHVDAIALCAQCHDPAAMKHPYDVQQVNPPAGLPFDPEGRIVCHTCHDPHDVKAQEHGLRVAYVDLCMKCHVRHGQKPASPAATPHQ